MTVLLWTMVVSPTHSVILTSTLEEVNGFCQVWVSLSGENVDELIWEWTWFMTNSTSKPVLSYLTTLFGWDTHFGLSHWLFPVPQVMVLFDFCFESPTWNSDFRCHFGDRRIRGIWYLRTYGSVPFPPINSVEIYPSIVSTVSPRTLCYLPLTVTGWTSPRSFFVILTPIPVQNIINFQKNIYYRDTPDSVTSNPFSNGRHRDWRRDTECV